MTNLADRDKAIIWHPFTQAKIAPLVMPIKAAKGSYIFDEDGKAYLDLISSWWVNLHGHANSKIAEAIYEQAKKLEHVIFAGFTHEPAVTLCEKLQNILPPSLSRFFFSDNGSTAVEVALKLSYQYWLNLGYKKTKFVSFVGGYHGDTFGAMAVGCKSGFHDKFMDLCFDVLSLSYPEFWQGCEEIEEKEQKILQQFECYLEEYSDNIAALILEPLVQGASGMRMCRPDFVKELVQKAQSHDILVIFDEIMTGFCRTATYFALDQIGVVPDFLCLSKGLTGGFLPLALTVTNSKIYEAFLADDFSYAFAHGHSYTANPLACSAGIASLDLLQALSCQQNIRQINLAHQAGMEKLRQISHVEKPRITGTIAAFDLKADLSKIKAIKEQALAEAMLIRPLGQSFYLLPPYCITPQELALCYDKLANIIDNIL